MIERYRVYGIFNTLGRFLKGTMIEFFMKYPDFVRSDKWISLVEAGESISEKILIALCGRSCIPVCGSPGSVDLNG
jgi:hypothetical protein